MNSSSAKPQPLFLTVDGIDGVGKSTQIQGLAEHLQELGYDVLCLRDPGSTALGQKLRSILLDSELTMHRRSEAMLFMASRCEMVETVIRPALAAGKTVISDRFLLANVVYQACSEVTAASLWELGRLSIAGLQPDITILLDMPAQAALQRLDRAHDRMESRGHDYLESVRQKFLAELPNSSDKTVLVNADQPPEQVRGQLIRAVEQLIAGQKG